MESFPEMTNKVTALVRATGIEDPGRMSGGAGRERPDPEVPERARRRTFTAKYKLEILAAYDAAPDGEKGALLRREGLYSSLISEWRKQRDAGVLAGKRPGEKVGRLTAEQAEIARLTRELARANKRLHTTEAALDIMGKAHALLESLSERADSDEQRKKR